MDRTYGGDRGSLVTGPQAQIVTGAEYSLPCDGLTYTQLLDNGFGFASSVTPNTPHTLLTPSPSSAEATPIRAQVHIQALMLFI